LKDSSGFFEADFSGGKGKDTTNALARAKLAKFKESQRRLGRSGGGVTEERVTIDGNLIRIKYPQIGTESEDYTSFESTEVGEVFSFTSARCAKFWTDANLVFGDVVVEQGNYDPDYPGVYSAWLKKTESGWNLLFNHQGDIWGTMHDPEFDAVEVPLTQGTLAEPAESLSIKFEKNGSEGGTIRIQFGPNEWTAAFTIR
jgi:hypothetical protein